MRPTPLRRSAPPQQDSYDTPTAMKALHVSIPLRPQQTPSALPPRLTQAVKEEFAIRYLQQIGANSTPENIAMTLQHLPLEKCAVSAAWKSRGSLADMLVIDLNPKAVAKAMETPLRADAAQGVNNNKETTSSANISQSSPRRQLRTEQTRHVYRVGSVSFTFNDMKRKFLVPFKLATTPPEPNVLQLYGAHAEADIDLAEEMSFHQAQVLKTSTSPGSLAAQRRWETQRRLKCVDERNEPPNASTETVSEMHDEFYLALPLVSLGLPESDEQMRTKLYETLVSRTMVELVQSTVKYLFLTVIHPATTVREVRLDSNNQDALFVSIAQNFAMLRAKMERTERSAPRAQPAVLVPLLLLALRVDVETLVRLQYPMSFACVSHEMERLLQVIDDTISQLLDPNANWSRLAVLETTHEAGQARASSSFQRARRHRRLRDQFFQTSTALHGLLPEPSSGKCRRVVTLRGGAEIGYYPELSSEPKDVVSVSNSSKLSLLRSLRRSHAS